jgi:hypothetical protein
MLKAGTASIDISPVTPMFLAGYPHVPRISTGIHDPLYATALALDNGKAALIKVTVDIICFNPPTARDLRQRIAAATGVTDAGVFVSCTHTHSGPITTDTPNAKDDAVVPPCDPTYLARLTAGVVDAATQAWAKRAPAEIAWTSCAVDGVGCNRHRPDAPRDPECGLLVVRSPQTRRLTALSLVYGMHPTVLHEDSTLVSADFPGCCRHYLGARLGEDVTVLYDNGLCGNQSPRYHVRNQTFAEAERLGNRLGEFIAQAVSTLTDADFSDSVVLAGVLEAVAIERRRFPTVTEAETTLKHARAEYARLTAAGTPHGPVRTAECAVFGAEETLTLARLQTTGELDAAMKACNPIDVQVVRIGDRCLAGFPCETFVEYGLELKLKTVMKTHPVTLVNGELNGYIVTEDAYAKGGYEAWNSFFAPAVGARLTATAARLVAKLAEIASA